MTWDVPKYIRKVWVHRYPQCSLLTQVGTFVRRNLPQGSEDAYTNAELTELNVERVQGDRFAPYEGAVP